MASYNLIIIFITLHFILLSNIATTCSCVKSNYRESFCSNDYVAIVTVNSKLQCTDWFTCYDVTLIRQFKSLTVTGKMTHGQVREIITANNTSSCGQEFDLNKQYLIFGSLLEGKIRSKVEVYSCSYSIRWSTLTYKERRNHLREIKPNVPCTKIRKRVLSSTEFN